jgi:hypothetical protein
MLSSLVPQPAQPHAERDQHIPMRDAEHRSGIRSPWTTNSPRPYALLTITTSRKPDSVSRVKITPALPLSDRTIQHHANKQGHLLLLLLCFTPHPHYFSLR